MLNSLGIVSTVNKTNVPDFTAKVGIPRGACTFAPTQKPKTPEQIMHDRFERQAQRTLEKAKDKPAEQRTLADKITIALDWFKKLTEPKILS